MPGLHSSRFGLVSEGASGGSGFLAGEMTSSGRPLNGWGLQPISSRSWRTVVGRRRQQNILISQFSLLI